MSKGAFSRREFIVTGAAAAAAVSGIPFVRTAAAQQAPIRVGVVGTGGRGTGACANALMADPAVEIVAMGDVGMDRVEQSLNALKRDGSLAGDEFQRRIKVTPETMFSGLDAYKQVMSVDLDYVILTEPPGLRPLSYDEAVNRGLHVFAEKPVAVDPAGCRKIRASAEQAKEKGLSVVVGLQRRYSPGLQETIKRIHDGALGEITSGSIHRMGGGLWHRGVDPSWSPMEYQMRNWYYHCWLSGDQIVEMVIHHIDTLNWALGATPISALAQGGRQQRTDPKYGDIWDNMTVDYEYPGDVHLHLMCRQWDGCANKSQDRVIGKLGESDVSRMITGANAWRYPVRQDEDVNPLVHEHAVLIESIRNGRARNDMLDYAIDSTLTAILGREAAYTGRNITWEEISNADLDLFPESYPSGPAPQAAVPIPGSPRLT